MCGYMCVFVYVYICAFLLHIHACINDANKHVMYAGMVGAIAKPFNVKSLCTFLSKVVDWAE